MVTKSKKREYEFTLALDGIEDITEELANRIYEAGCGDGGLAMTNGRAFIEFDRVAGSFAEAILSAIRDVEKAGVKVARVSAAELVNASEIARRIGRTRQNVGQFIAGERGPGGFPGAVWEGEGGKSPLWLWSDVADWFHKQGIVSEDEVQDARDVAAINGALDLARHAFRNKRIENGVLRLVGRDAKKTKTPIA